MLISPLSLLPWAMSFVLEGILLFRKTVSFVSIMSWDLTDHGGPGSVVGCV